MLRRALVPISVRKLQSAIAFLISIDSLCVGNTTYKALDFLKMEAVAFIRFEILEGNAEATGG